MDNQRMSYFGIRLGQHIPEFLCVFINDIDPDLNYLHLNAADLTLKYIFCKWFPWRIVCRRSHLNDHALRAPKKLSIRVKSGQNFIGNAGNFSTEIRPM